MFKTHVLFGFFIGALLFLINKSILFLLLIILGSIFPDVDEHKSFIGRRLPVISRILNFLFGHRGIFHTIFIGMIIFIGFYLSGFLLLGLGFFIGYLSHLLLDSLTLLGVKLFWPITNLQLRGFVRTGGFTEYLFFIILSISTVIMIFNYFLQINILKMFF